jgi:hypothetical protein
LSEEEKEDNSVEEKEEKKVNTGDPMVERAGSAKHLFEP